MIKAGCEMKPATFIMTDSQIMYESFLEDINNILNTGEITGMYKDDDLKRIYEEIEQQNRELGLVQAMTKDEQY